MPLVVDGNEIRKISGPVSMSILTPKNSDLFPKLPVYILFGDVHNDSRNSCKRSKSEGVYSVYDIEFLGLLSNVATPTRPIDFYIEGGDLHNKTHKKPYSEKYPMEMLWNLYAECYTHNGRKIARYKHRTKCNSISNIRWHSGDARYFESEKYRLENCNMLRFLERVNFGVKYDNRYLEIVNMVKGECVSKVRKRKEETNDYTSLKNFVLQRDGLIYKQLKKINPKQRKVLIGWIEKFCKYRLSKIHRNYGVTDRTIELYNYLDLHLTRCEDEDYYNKYLSDHWESISLYLYYLRRKYTIVLDIYTICRSFKYLGLKGPMPMMNIIYAGDVHTNDIKYFLETITSLYNVQTVGEFNGDFNNANRCVEIREKIDLGVILNQNLDKTVRVSPKGKRVQAKSRGVSHKGKRVSQKRKRVSQKRKRVSHKRKRVSPKRKRVLPKRKRISPKSKRVSPKRKRVSPKRKRVSQKRKRVQAKRKRVSPKRKRVSPKRKRVQPKPKRVQPKPKRVSPKRKRVSPKRKRVPPKRKRVPAKRKRVPPKLKRVQAKPKRVSPKRKRVSAKRKRVPLKLKRVSPKPKRVSQKKYYK
jgi:hypothetical protein